MHQWLARFRQHRHQNPLALRLLAYILLFSSLITLLSTAMQVYLDYRNDLDLITDRIQQLETTAIDSLATEIWLINDERIAIQLDGMRQLPDMQQLELKTQYGEHFLVGDNPPAETPLLVRHYPLSHTTAEGERYALGELTLRVNLTRVYQDLKDRILVILLSQGVKTFLVSVFILYIFWKLVTQHLGALSRYADGLNLNRLDQPAKLHRAPKKPDELSRLVNALNRMRLSLLDDIQKRQEAERALAKLNEELEQRVEQRTEQLQQTNQELLDTLDQLRNTQKQLVESEKMAALGNLVAGIAHEINTPIGIGVTAATWLRDQAHQQQRSVATPDNWREFVDNAAESSELITSNLQRAAQLISAFKQVSVDQSSEQPRLFDLRNYLNEVLISLAPQLRQSKPQIQLYCDEGLMLNSYPGALYQILVNLIQNSLIHGFDNQPGGQINIQIQQQGNEITLDYQDSGKGIDAELQSRVFEPFFTTRRNQGCSGLGLHISYNLATQLLGGSLHCLEADRLPGAHFQLRFVEQKPAQPTMS